MIEPDRAPDAIWVRANHFQAMLRHVRACTPEEGCGIVAGGSWRSEQVFTLTNALRSPTRYRAAAEDQLAAWRALRERGWEMIAIFHSHPRGPIRPSATDVAEAYYPHCAYLVWGPQGAKRAAWACRAFRIEGGEVSEIPLHRV